MWAAAAAPASPSFKAAPSEAEAAVAAHVPSDGVGDFEAEPSGCEAFPEAGDSEVERPERWPDAGSDEDAINTQPRMTTVTRDWEHQSTKQHHGLTEAQERRHQ
eukprot:4938893-Pyramimonas_sp.AAC.1